jgi:hypothetical protein
MSLTVFEFNKLVKKLIVELGERFTKPDDDWLPAAFLLTKDGDIVQIVFDPRCFANDESKASVAANLADVAKNAETLALALLINCWMSMLHRDSVTVSETGIVSGAPMPEDDPEHTEALILQLFSKDGEKIDFARIERQSDRPPTLSPWRSMGDEFKDFTFAEIAEAFLNA